MNWADELIVKMRHDRVTVQMVAKRLGVSGQYISSVLYGHPVSDRQRTRIMTAVDEIIKEQKETKAR